MAVNVLNDEQMERYSRHILLDEVGVEGQKKLLNSKVVVIGAGGLGCPSSLYMAAAGVGTIGIVDGDKVDLSNLQRQILHYNHDIGRPKTQSAKRTIQDINPDTQVITHQTVISSENAVDILKDYDVVVNGCDNFPTRYLVNDACMILNKPMVDAGILKFEGHATIFTKGTGCYRCLYPTPPPPGEVPSCAEGGVIGAIAGYMGTLQAIETIKVLLNIGKPLTDRLMIFNALTGEIRFLKKRRDLACPVCSDNPTITKLIDYNEFCGVPGHTVQTVPVATQAPTPGGLKPELTPPEVMELIKSGNVQLIDVRGMNEYAEMHIDGAKLIPLDVIQSRLSEIDPGRPTVMICRVGQRSKKAAEIATAAGYKNVANMKGGMMQWVNLNLPFETGAPKG